MTNLFCGQANTRDGGEDRGARERASRQVMFRYRGDSQHVLSLCQRPRWQHRESHPEIRRMWRRKPTCEGPYMDTFALAGCQNILWLVQWCRCLSGEPSARPCGAVTLLSNLYGTQEICAVGVRGRPQISSQTCTDGCNNGPSNATGPVKTITVMVLDAPRDGARNRHRTHLLRC